MRTSNNCKTRLNYIYKFWLHKYDLETSFFCSTFIFPGMNQLKIVKYLLVVQARSTPAINPNGDKGSITYSTDRENEVGKILIISPGSKRRGRFFNSNTLLNLEGHKVNCSPLNWQIITYILTDRHNTPSPLMIAHLGLNKSPDTIANLHWRNVKWFSCLHSLM